MRDADGEPRLVGHVVNVATRAYARGQGHAGRLLELTIEAMQQDGCSWSLLFTGDEARPFYERYGWHAYPRRWPQGTLSDSRPPASESYVVHRYDPMNQPNGWEMLGQVYSEYNAKRPLSVVRDLDYWRGFAAMRFSDWILNDKATILAATRTPSQHNICGYVLAHFYGDGFAVTEIATRHGDEAAVEALLAAVWDYAMDGVPRGRLYLPLEVRIDAALQNFFIEVLWSEYDNELMARPIAADFDKRQLDAMFAAPGAMFWLIDDF